MLSVGEALRECRRDAKNGKLTQQKVAEAVNLVPSYVSKLETGGVIPNFSENDIEKLTQLFRKYQVSEIKIQDFTAAYTSSLVTGGLISDQDSAIAQKIYNTLKNLDDSKKSAYRKELTDRNNVWHGIHQTLGEFQSGSILFRETLKILDGLEETEDGSTSFIKSRLRLESSRLNRYLGEIGIAKTKLSQSLELAKKAKNDALLAEILIEKGDFSRRSDQENLRGAMQNYQEACTIYEDREDNDGKVSSQIRIASIYLTAGQPKDALPLCEETLKFARISRDPYLERKSLEYKAWALSMFGYYTDSIHLQLDAHEITIKSSGLPKEMAKSAAYLAGFYLMCDLFEEAEKYYIESDNYIEQMLKSTRASNSTEEKEIFIRVLIYLGLGAIKTQRPSERIEARSYLVKSLEFAEQSNDLLMYGRVLRQLGQLDITEGALENAKEKFEIAASSFKKSGLDKLGNPYYLSSLCFDLARLEYRLKKHSFATQHLENGKNLASKFGYHDHIIRYQLWDAMLLAVESVKANENEIIELCFSALSDAIKTDYYILRKSLILMKSDIERLYREGQNLDIIRIVKKIIKQVPERLHPESNSQTELIENWIRDLQLRVSEWDVLSKTLG